MRSPTLEDAIIFAAQCHKGQRDKAGEPYILHPLRVMMDPSLTTVEERIAAVLHDVVEDCHITFTHLEFRGYGDDVVKCIEYLTKLPEEEKDYEAFIRRVCSGPPMARKVKLADLRDNSDLTRLPNPTELDLKRQEKYLRAIKVLEAAT